MKRSRHDHKINQVNIAKLKIYLGRYLKKVKKGEEVIVLDHQHPVAKLIPYQESKKPQVEIIPAKEDFRKIEEYWSKKSSPEKATKLTKSILEYLREDRDSR